MKEEKKSLKAFPMEAHDPKCPYCENTSLVIKQNIYKNESTTIPANHTIWKCPNQKCRKEFIEIL